MKRDDHIYNYGLQADFMELGQNVMLDQKQISNIHQ